MASGGQGAPTGGWVRFYKTVGDRRVGFVAQRSETTHWVCIFKLARRSPLWYSDERLGSFLQDINPTSELASLRKTPDAWNPVARKTLPRKLTRRKKPTRRLTGTLL
jgi:hypothetical protein